MVDDYGLTASFGLSHCLQCALDLLVDPDFWMGEGVPLRELIST